MRAALVPSTYLFVQLDECGLEQLLIVIANVARVLHVRQRLAQVALLGQKVLLHGSWECMQRYGDVFGVAELLKLDMGDSLVCNVGWVVGWNVSRKFREI